MIRVGAIAPLSRPGLVAAGRDLADGLELAVVDLNDRGGVNGEQLELLLCDSQGDPAEAVAAVNDLHRSGVVALVGEFHSVVADRVAARIDELQLPFVCSSATLDALTARKPRWLFRLAPPQAYGWAIFANFLVAAAYQEVVIAITSDVYWESGAAVLTRHLADSGIAVSRVDVDRAPDEVLAGLAALDADSNRSALLLLVGFPSPLCEIVQAIRAEERFSQVLIGDPAGRAAFADWWTVVGDAGLRVPYLAYLPDELPSSGRAFAQRFASRYGREPTFVAHEGYDTILILAAALARGGDEHEALRVALGEIAVDGTRGHIRFTTEASGVVHQQWTWPPVAVVAASRVGATPSQVMTLYRPPT